MAWIVIILLPVLMMMFRAIHSHYVTVTQEIALRRDARPPRPRRNLVMIPMEIKWAQWGCGVPLIVIPSPYRSVLGFLLDYIEKQLEKDPECWITVCCRNLARSLVAACLTWSTSTVAERRIVVQRSSRGNRRALSHDEVSLTAEGIGGE
jgi:hypothetical protein